MRLLFARHGESEANVRHEIANRHSTHALTATGRAQAIALAEAVRGLGVDRILSSPIRRAAETSEIAGRALGIPVEFADALREFDCGIYEGRSDDEAWTAHAEIQAQWFERGRPEARLDGGESLVDLRDRFVPFIEGLVAEDNERDEAILLVAHGGLYRCVLPEVITNIDPAIARRRYLDHARYVVAVSSPGSRLACVSWPD